MRKTEKRRKEIELEAKSVDLEGKAGADAVVSTDNTELQRRLRLRGSRAGRAEAVPPEIDPKSHQLCPKRHRLHEWTCSVTGKCSALMPIHEHVTPVPPHLTSACTIVHPLLSVIQAVTHVTEMGACTVPNRETYCWSAEQGATLTSAVNVQRRHYHRTKWPPCLLIRTYSSRSQANSTCNRSRRRKRIPGGPAKETRLLAMTTMTTATSAACCSGGPAFQPSGEGDVPAVVERGEGRHGSRIASIARLWLFGVIPKVKYGYACFALLPAV